MKKFVSLLLALALLLSLAACASAGTAVPGSEPASGEAPVPTGAETAAPTQTAAQTEPGTTAETAEDMEPEPADTTEPMVTEEPAEPTEEAPTEPWGEFPAGTDLGALNLADTAWAAECIREDKWVGLALDFYADGSLYYREGRMFSEYALYLDGLWRTEEDGTLDLTLWYSPYDGWDRPNDYRVTAADVPADCWTARFSCEPRKGDCLDLTWQTERGFVNAEEDRWIEFHAAEEMPIVTLQELRDFAARDDEEYARLLAGGQDGWDLFGYGGWTKFRGIAKAGSYYAAKVEYSVAFTISEAELAQAAQDGRVTLQRQEYLYVASSEEAAQYGPVGNEYCGQYGGILKLRADGQVDYGYWVERAGDRYFFVYEIGGMIGRLETVEERCWVMLDPEMPTVFGPGEYEDKPKTLDECGSVAANMLATPSWDEDDGFSVYIDMR